MTQIQDPHYRRPMPAKKTVTREEHASVGPLILRTPISAPWRKFRNLISGIAKANWWINARKRLDAAVHPQKSADVKQQAEALSTWEDEGGTSAATKRPSMNAK